MNNNFVQNCSELQESVHISDNSSREQDNIGENIVPEVIDGRLKGKFVSPKVINLSTRIFSKAESVNKVLIKEELCFGRKLRLLWHFWNEDSITISNPIKNKPTFNRRGNDAAIELYLSRLEDEIMANDTKSYSSFTNEELLALNSLKNDTSVIEEADKRLSKVVWDGKIT